MDLKKLVIEQDERHSKTGIGRISESWTIEVDGEKIRNIQSPKSLLSFVTDLKKETGENIIITRESTGETEII